MADYSVQATGYQTDQLYWGRACSLTITNAAGNGYDLSSLRVKFRVVSKTANNFKFAEITVYNTNPATTQALFDLDEFTTVTLSAGYRSGAFGLIFKGSIAYIKTGKEDALNTFVTLIATDSSDAYAYATINTTLKAGATIATQLDEVLKVLKDFGIVKGFFPGDLPVEELPRGKALYGKVGQVLNDLAQAAKCYWSIADGKLNLLHPTGYLPGDIFILTPQTGLVGAPEQTLDGLNARALLNPNLICGARIQIQGDQVTQSAYGSAPLPDQSVPVLPTLAKNGIYVIYSLAQVGDTRGTGNDWLSEMVAVNPASVPVSGLYGNAAAISGA